MRVNLKTVSDENLIEITVDEAVDLEDFPGEGEEEVDLEDGLKRLEHNFVFEENEADLEEKKEEFRKLVAGKQGKFILWGMEYQLSLLFEEKV